eukprot:234864-Hanusia_phi.AAC.2
MQNIILLPKMNELQYLLPIEAHLKFSQVQAMYLLSIGEETVCHRRPLPVSVEKCEVRDSNFRPQFRVQTTLGDPKA